ncbi:MAG: hypothetical protein ACXVJE_17200, partial [Mucilaginibacter sp.]
VSHKTGQGSSTPTLNDTAAGATLPGPHSRPISDSLAQKLMAEYNAENDTAKRPIKNDAGQNLRGYFINRGPLDHILKNPNVTGISIYLGVDSLARLRRFRDRVYTLIYMGATINKKYTIGGSEPKLINGMGTGDSTVYDFAQPCPNACGTFLTLHDKGKSKK